MSCILELYGDMLLVKEYSRTSLLDYRIKLLMCYSVIQTSRLMPTSSTLFLSHKPFLSWVLWKTFHCLGEWKLIYNFFRFVLLNTGGALIVDPGTRMFTRSVQYDFCPFLLLGNIATNFTLLKNEKYPDICENKVSFCLLLDIASWTQPSSQLIEGEKTVIRGLFLLNVRAC